MTKRMGMMAAAGLIAGVVAGAGTAFGQTVVYPRGYGVASDLDAPYEALPRDLPPPPLRGYAPRYSEREYDGPIVLPPTAVYGILRGNGYSPLGIPQQRGFVYTISVISPDGDDGRLVIDARSGRILRFLPAYRMGDRMGEEITVSYGPTGALPPMPSPGATLRPLAALPRVASRAPGVPLPKPMPARAVASPPQPAAPKAAAARSQPADAQASIQKPADPVPANPPPVIEATPTPVAPAAAATPEMPPVQGLE